MTCLRGRMAEDGSRRYPPNLRGLLNFCTEYTQSEDAPSASGLSAMSEEVFVTLFLLFFNLLSSEYGQTSTSRRLLTSSCGRAGIAECITQKVQVHNCCAD